MPDLQLKNLSYLDWQPVNLTVPAGKRVGICGPSGSGKSLLLRAIADLIPHHGTVLLESQDMNAMPAPLWRRQVGLLPAESFWWAERVRDHFPENLPHPEAMDAVGLNTSLADAPVAQLSSGERQRMALLRALAVEPKALLLDEPTANLDQDSTNRVETWIIDWLEAREAPALWVTHSPEQLERVTERRLVFRDKRLYPLETGKESSTGAQMAEQ